MKRTFKNGRLARHMGLDIVLKRQVTSPDPGVSGPALATKEMFTYLHKRHVIPTSKIATALADIKSEDVYPTQLRVPNLEIWWVKLN
jgi:hypothetical protein